MINNPPLVVFDPIEMMAQAAQFEIPLNTGAGTTDICTATGDLLIFCTNVYVHTPGLLIVSAQIKTSQTNSVDLMSSSEGALLNLTAQRNLTLANERKVIHLAQGQKLQATSVGVTVGSGQLDLHLVYYPITPGASLV